MREREIKLGMIKEKKKILDFQSLRKDLHFKKVNKAHVNRSP